jgi:hypothetical protein
MKKLNNQGVSHILLPVLVAALVAVVGIAALYRAHASTSSTTTTSTVAAGTPIPTLHICLVHGTGCIGAPTVNSGDKVELTSSGRDLQELAQGGAQYKLRFNADTSKCVGASSDDNLTVRDCSNGSANVVWVKNFVSGGIHWFNSTNGLYLGSNNTLNQQLFECSYPCNGKYILWNN